MASQQQQPARYTNKDLTILYLVENPSHNDVIKSFSIQETEELTLTYPNTFFRSEYDFNLIEITEDKETQRYIVSYYDNNVMPLMKLVKRECYPMQKNTLTVRFE